MATINQIKRNAEAFYDLYSPQMIAAQDGYKATHGIFWQGLVNPSTPPDDGALLPPEVGTHPTDQVETWQQVFPFLPATVWPLSASVDVYEGPVGIGWTFRAIFTKGGIEYSFTWNFGPETWRQSSDWVARDLTAAPQTLMASTAPVTLWDKTKALAAKTWEVLNTPVGELFKRNA